MRVLELTGVVADCDLQWDEWMAGNVEGPSIGGVRVIAAFHETFPEIGTYGKIAVTVLLSSGGDADLYRGDAWGCEGDHGYSTYTPGSSPDFWVTTAEGLPHVDLYDRLVNLEGETVTLRIDDGPVVSKTVPNEPS